MRALLLLLLFIGSWHIASAQATAPAAATPTAKQLRLAENLLNSVYSEASFDQLIDQAVTTQTNANATLKPYTSVMRDFMRKYMGWSTMRPQLAAIYAREFTEAELLDITRYYQSPTGQKAAARMPALMKAGMEIGQNAVQAHLPELTKALQEKMEADKQ